MVVLRARGGIMEREFAFGVVIQLLAPSVEPLGPRSASSCSPARPGSPPAVRGGPRPRAADDRLFARFHGLHWLSPARRGGPARPARRRRALGRRALAALPRLPRGEVDALPACADRRGPDGRTGGAGGPDAAGRARAAARGPAAAAQPGGRRELVRGGLGDDMATTICPVCARHGGNPLLARQLIAALGERGSSREPRAECDRRHGAAVGGALRVRAAAAPPPAVGGRRARARDPRRRRVARRHRRGRGRRPRSDGRRGRHAGSRRAPAPARCRRGSSTRSSSRRSRTRSRRPSGRSCSSPPPASSRATRRAASARPATSGHRTRQVSAGRSTP